eukprot:c3375_g1_i1 orf=79-1530(-)
MASSLRKHHALAVPLPGQGHINPLMRFCKKLASEEGFTITFVNIEPLHHRIAELNPLQENGSSSLGRAEEASSHGKLDIRRVHVPFPAMPAAADPRQVSIECVFGALPSLAPHLEKLLFQLMREDPPITCLISDMYMTGATQSVADSFNIPRIALYPSSQSVLLFSNYILEGAVSLEDVVEEAKKRDRSREPSTFVKGLSGLLALNNVDIMNYDDANLFMYKLNSQTLQETKERAHAIVVNSFNELEGSALKVPFGLPVYGVGPLVEPLEEEASTSLWKEDKECMAWLNDQPCQSVIYISFGTFASLSNTQFEEIVAGLLSSQQRFLWVFRPSLVRDACYSSFPIEVLSKSHGKGYSVDWAPQLSILSHPSVCAFLTHCGWNSTVEAISHGVPMLCFPLFSDQFMDAKYIVEEWKVGLGFEVCKESGLVERNEVERVIQALMEGEKGKLLDKNVKHFKEASNKTLMPEGASSKNIKALVQSLS